MIAHRSWTIVAIFCANVADDVVLDRDDAGHLVDQAPEHAQPQRLVGEEQRGHQHHRDVLRDGPVVVDERVLGVAAAPVRRQHHQQVRAGLAREVGELDLRAGPPLPVGGDDHRAAIRVCEMTILSTSPTSRSVRSEWSESP